MAGKSGRSINNVPENPMKHIIFSWEGILVILFILVNIFCASFSEFYNMKSVLRQMPVYLAEVFMMFPMAYILVLGEIDISVGAIVCLSAVSFPSVPPFYGLLGLRVRYHVPHQPRT